MAAEVDEVVGSLENLPVAAILTDLASRRVVAVNARAAAVVGAPVRDLLGIDVLTHIDAQDRRAAEEASAAMAAGVIDGCQMRRRVLGSDGTVTTLSVSGRRVGNPNHEHGLWILVPVAGSAGPVDALVIGSSAVVFAVTDHDWGIEYMSADAALLGSKGAELRGFPLLGLVHPAGAAEFMAAAARTSTEGLTATVLTRLRVGPGQWAERFCLIARLCEHDPPRLGLVISQGPEKECPSSSGRTLDEQLQQCAVEAHASVTLDAVPVLLGLPRGDELSARQTEVVARLIGGQTTSSIAQAMHLSPSTIRNHLTAIYKRFGVHSQSQLLATLLRSATPD